MGTPNAERQRQWRERHQVVLTGPAKAIAGKLIGMADQTKLRRVHALIGDHLKPKAARKPRPR